MSGWLLPAAATGLWLGLLARPAVGEGAPVAVWLLGAALALGTAALMTPSRGEHRDPLFTLAPPAFAEPALRAVSPPTLVRRISPPLLPAFLAVLGMVALGVGWGSADAHRIEGAALARLAPAGVVADAVLRTDPRVAIDRWSAIADVRLVRADGVVLSVHESVWLNGEEDPLRAVRGDRIRVTGRILLPEDPDFGGFLLQHGLAAELEVDEAERLGPSDVAIIRWAQSFRGLVGGSIRELFPSREAGLLLGLSLGDDTLLDPALERDFRASGLSHLLVVSGGNVAMVLAPVLALGSLFGLGRWSRFALGLGTVVFFVVLTGAEPSVLRAGTMAGLTLLAILLGRPRSAASILAASVLALLVLDPSLVWQVGFQLSVAATAGMVALATPVADRLRFLPRPVALAAGATVAAQLGVTPMLLYHFHEVPLATLVANVLAFPAVAPSMLLGLTAAGAGLVVPAVGRFVAALALAPMRYLEGVADQAARAPVPWITGRGTATLVVGLLVVVALALWIRSGRAAPRPVLFAGALLAPLLIWSIALSSGPPSSLTVRFFDVGQGDAALLTSPAGVSVLIDGGPDPAQVATEVVALGVKRLDVVVASHPHADHVIGLPAVLSRIPVGLLLEPGCPAESPDAVALAEAVGAEGVPVGHPRAGDVLVVGDVRFEILSPDRCWTGTESDSNNDAIVLRASIGEDSVLFATEPEEPAQQVMLDADVDLTADVLKVPHHGGATSIEAFFQAVDAEIAVVSVGPNTYGHPVPEVLAWIGATGAEVFRTDRDGKVTVAFGDRGVLVESGA